jgi:hypothetical protein
MIYISGIILRKKKFLLNAKHAKYYKRYKQFFILLMIAVLKKKSLKKADLTVLGYDLMTSSFNSSQRFIKSKKFKLFKEKKNFRYS